MIPRIVLSALLLLGLCAAACDTAYHGIGTSPSVDDDPTAEASSPLETATPGECAIWVDQAGATAADARALNGGPPDVIVYTLGHTTCVDAITISNRLWPGKSAVRYAEPTWRAAGVGAP